MLRAKASTENDWPADSEGGSVWLLHSSLAVTGEDVEAVQASERSGTPPAQARTLAYVTTGEEEICRTSWAAVSWTRDGRRFCFCSLQNQSLNWKPEQRRTDPAPLWGAGLSPQVPGTERLSPCRLRSLLGKSLSGFLQRLQIYCCLLLSVEREQCVPVSLLSPLCAEPLPSKERTIRISLLAQTKRTFILGWWVDHQHVVSFTCGSSKRLFRLSKLWFILALRRLSTWCLRVCEVKYPQIHMNEEIVNQAERRQKPDRSNYGPQPSHSDDTRWLIHVPSVWGMNPLNLEKVSWFQSNKQLQPCDDLAAPGWKWPLGLHSPLLFPVGVVLGHTHNQSEFSFKSRFCSMSNCKTKLCFLLLHLKIASTK